MFTPSPELESAIRILAETRAEFLEMLGDDYVERPPRANPMEDAIRALAESRAMLDDILEDGDEPSSGDEPKSGDDDP